MAFSLYLTVGCIFVGFGLTIGGFDEDAPFFGKICECLVVLFGWPIIVYLIWEEW